MKHLIQEYIAERELAWAPSTLKSELHRLLAVADLLDGDPNRLWVYLEQNQKPYSRVTTWTRVSNFYQWAILNGKVKGINHYEKFREKNQRLFKNCYTPKFPEISFAEAKARIRTLARVDVNLLAEFLLSNGARYSESRNGEDGQVVGKGNKTRTVYGSQIEKNHSGISYHTFRRELAKIGLRPHELRKLCATELVARGLREADLCKVMGWSSIVTAKAYLIPKKDEELKEIFERMNA